MKTVLTKRGELYKMQKKIEGENMLSIIVAKSKNNVIGGASIYKILMPYCKKMYITQIEENFDGDAFFPEIEKEPFR